MVLGGLLVIWLLFLPSSPYILTDLFHLRKNITMPLWYDLIMILSFAFTGLLFGFLSLLQLEIQLKALIKPLAVKLILVMLLFLSAFGVYLGRYLRWNSWDVFTRPLELFYQIGIRVLEPMQNLNTWGMTLFFGLLLNMFFWTFKSLRHEN